MLTSSSLLAGLCTPETSTQKLEVPEVIGGYKSKKRKQIHP